MGLSKRGGKTASEIRILRGIKHGLFFQTRNTEMERLEFSAESELDLDRSS